MGENTRKKAILHAIFAFKNMKNTFLQHFPLPGYGSSLVKEMQKGCKLAESIPRQVCVLGYATCLCAKRHTWGTWLDSFLYPHSRPLSLLPRAMEGAHDDKTHARKSGCCKLSKAITLQQVKLMQKAVYLRDGELITNRSRGGSARSAEAQQSFS